MTGVINKKNFKYFVARRTSTTTKFVADLVLVLVSVVLTICKFFVACLSLAGAENEVRELRSRRDNSHTATFFEFFLH